MRRTCFPRNFESEVLHYATILSVVLEINWKREGEWGRMGKREILKGMHPAVVLLLHRTKKEILWDFLCRNSGLCLILRIEIMTLRCCLWVRFNPGELAEFLRHDSILLFSCVIEKDDTGL